MPDSQFGGYPHVSAPQQLDGFPIMSVTPVSRQVPKSPVGQLRVGTTPSFPDNITHTQHQLYPAIHVHGPRGRNEASG